MGARQLHRAGTDARSEGPDGAVYVTASHIQDTNWYKPGAPLRWQPRLSAASYMRRFAQASVGGGVGVAYCADRRSVRKVTE